jgi:hypothetical protein
MLRSMYLMECLCIETIEACGVFQNLRICYNTKSIFSIFYKNVLRYRAL